MEQREKVSAAYGALNFSLSLVLPVSYGVIVKTEIIRLVTGLGVLKHNAAAAEGPAADYSDAVVIHSVHFQIFFVIFRGRAVAFSVRRIQGGDHGRASERRS